MKAEPKVKSPFKHKLLCLAVASCFSLPQALANPTGPAVVAGQVSISQQGPLLSVTNSPSSIVNWQSFSIAGHETTRFIQQSAASAILNRVTGSAGVIDPSVILGALQSNGQVFLINTAGILFGAGAQINVAGLVASTLNLSNEDFLAGRLNFSSGPLAGSVQNQGQITTPAGGNVYLIAPKIENSGVITSPQGEVILAAGKSVRLMDSGTPNVKVEITAPDTEALNLGQIVAKSGRVGIYAAAIRHQGVINADTVIAGENGTIYLKATKDITLEPGSVITANGPTGGGITIQSGDTTLVSGTVEAKGSEGQGGIVKVLGNLVGLLDNATINASGETGGGIVLVGGDYRGGNPDVQNAWRTYFGPSVTIDASATQRGDGGKVIVWSNDVTRFYGTILARGGATSGNGGFVEVSGKRSLAFAGTADTHAPNGVTGTLLLDPLNIIISSALPDINGDLTTGDDLASPTLAFGDFPSAMSIISPGAVVAQLSSSNVTLQATNDITVSATINDGGAADSRTLALEANNNVNVYANILLGGSRNLVLKADADSNLLGNVTITPTSVPVVVNVGGNITVSGVNFNVLGGSNLPVSVTAGGDLIVGQIAGNPLPLTGMMKVQGGTACCGADASATVRANGNVFVKADKIEVRGGSATAFASEGVTTASANAELSAGQSMTLTVGTSGIMVAGGTANASASSGAVAMANANALVSAGGAMTITISGGILDVAGGETVVAIANGAATVATASANATLSTGTDISIVADAIEVKGGTVQARASSGGMATAVADAKISAGRDLIINIVSGELEVGGGTAAGSAGTPGAIATNGGTAVATANAILSAGNDIQITADQITVKGGKVQASASGGVATAAVDAKISAGRDLILNIGAGGLEVAGGNAGVEDEVPPTVGAIANGGTAVGSAIAKVSAGRDLTATVNGTFEIESGNVGNEFGAPDPRAAPGAITNDGSATARTDAEFSAGRDLNVTVSTGDLILEAGDAGASATAASGTNTALATSNVLFSAVNQMNVLISSGALRLNKGESSAVTSGAGANTARAEVNVLMLAGGAKTLNVSGDLSLTGGSASSAGLNAAAFAFALIDPGVLSIITGGNVLLTGGTGPNTSATIQATGPINFTIGGAGGLILNGGTGSGLFPSSQFPITVNNTAFTTPTTVSSGAFTVNPFPLQAVASVVTFDLPAAPLPPPPPPLTSEAPLLPPDIIRDINRTIVDPLTQQVAPLIEKDEGKLIRTKRGTCN